MKILYALLLVLIVAPGCASNWMPPLPTISWAPAKPAGESGQVAGAPANPVEESGQVTADYKIGPGDVLEISVYGEDSLNRKDLVVRPDGKTSFPLVGDVQVGGLTTVQAKEALEQSLHEYIPEAVAAISVLQLGSLQYYVVGKVNKPGMYNVSKPLTVLQALAMAGGLTTFAQESKIVILRNVGKETVTLPFNYKKIKKGLGLQENIIMERGDVVVVP
ncbi:MAG: polysaccharide biosynthesis/export family protein [Syntrophobacteraceae bacterium]|jgi:polysaccharide export outer membrane protein